MKNLFTLIAGIALLTSCEKKEAPPQAMLPLVTGSAVIQKDALIYRSYVGHSMQLATVDITPQVTGKLTGAFFTQGGDVKAGELLFKIDDTPFTLALASAEAALLASKAAFGVADEKLQRYSSLLEQGYISRVDYDSLANMRAGALSAMKQADVAVQTARVNLGYCSITAPISGVAGPLKVDVGNIVSAAPLLTINQITPIYITFFVPQTDFSFLKVGMETSVTTESGETLSGPLSLIDNSVDPSTGTILARATLQNSEKKLWPGQFLPVKLLIGTQKDALLVAKQAVNQLQNGQFVFIIKEDGSVMQQSVETGDAVGEMQIILKGVNLSDRVVVEGQMGLMSGMKVRVAGKNG